MRELQAGLWHWEAPHPEWTPEQWWPQDVSSYAIDDGARLLLFDPLSVPDEILELAADREAAVVLTAPWHERDTQSLVERLGLPVFTPPPDTPADLVRKYGISLEELPQDWHSPDLAWLLAGVGGGEAHPYTAGDRLPGDVRAFPGRTHNDLVLWIERLGCRRHRRCAGRLRPRLRDPSRGAAARRYPRAGRRGTAAAARVADRARPPGARSTDRPFRARTRALLTAAASDDLRARAESHRGTHHAYTESKGASMRLLLTSAGIKNTSIHDALVELLGKPIADSNALCIPTAGYGHPQGSPGGAWRFITGQSSTPMCELGWNSLGVLELTALPSVGEERWLRWVRETDVLLVNGGDALYLCHWMRQSGLADLLPSLSDTVWVGLSAGSMVMTPRIGEDFVGWKPPGGGDSALGIVDFSIFPHLDHEELPDNSMAGAERWAAEIAGPAYAIDDQTAIRVSGGAVEVVSEGHWKLFAPGPSGAGDGSA